MKRKGKNRSRGAVSVFLTLVLVPCIIFTCAFGDLSRVQLNKSMAASAADLSLYSLMSHYDANLKEFYGIVASCQNVEKYYDEMGNYFVGMLDANGIEGKGSELFLSYVESLKQGNISDFLQSEILEVTVSDTAHAAVGSNPALIEDGIVEFMKYRGPASILADLIERFSKTGLSGGSDEISEDQQISEKRQEYAEAEAELMKVAYYTYRAIVNYLDAWNADPSFPATEGYQKLAGDLTKIWNDLGEVTELVTKYYFPDTQNLKRVNFPLYGLGTYTFQASNVGIEVVQEDGSKIYCLNNEKLQELLKNLDSNITALENATKAVAQACSEVKDPGNPAVYLLEVQEKVEGKLDSVTKNAMPVLKQYASLSAALNCVPFPDEGDNDLPSDWRSQLQEGMKKLESAQKRYLTRKGTSDYACLVADYDTCADNHWDKIMERKYTFQSSFAGGEVTLDTFAKAVANRVPEAVAVLEDLIGRLDLIIDGGNLTINGSLKTVYSLDTLQAMVYDYVNAREAWGDEAYSHNTEYAQQEQAYYSGEGGSDLDQTELDMQKLASEITEERVQELRERLENIRSDMQDCLDAIKAFTYGGTSIDQIQNGEQLVTLARPKLAARSSNSLEQNERDAAGYFKNLVAPSTATVYTAPEARSGTTGNHPDLDQDPPLLYEFFSDQFKGQTDQIDSKIEERETKEEEYAGKQEDAKNEASEVNDNYLAGLGGDISGGHGGNAVSIGTVISSIATTAKNVVSGNGDELRDQLYVCQYIMDMFSYSTINNEGRFKMMGDGSQYDTSVTLSQFPYDDNGWSEEDATKVYGNQSLTNRPINQNYNQANLGEVEYILYGNASTRQNLSTSYGNIYGIRLALNLVSGFCTFYSGSNSTAIAVQSVAATVAAISAGVIPIPVTKCLLIGVLAALESAKDLTRLKAGLPVVFYKSSEDEWCYGLDGNENFGSGSGKDVDANGLFYSDYMYLFLIMGLSSQSYSSMLLRVGDLIEANIRKNGNENFDLDKARAYFQLTATVRVKPLMLTLPLVSSMDGVDPSGVLSAEDWCTYHITVYRGYS